MEKYFTFKYYEEVVSCIMCIIIIVAPFAMVVFKEIKKWWNGDK